MSTEGPKDNPRVRTLTQKGIEQFEQSVQLFISHLARITEEVDRLINALNKAQLEEVQPIKEGLLNLRLDYIDHNKEFETFLFETRSQDSLKLLAQQKQTASQRLDLINNAICKAESLLEQRHSSPSHSMRSKIKSSKSSSSSALLRRHKAKAEVAKTRQKYIKKEIDLEMQQAALRADLKLLQSNREVEEAETELKIIDESFSEESVDDLSEYKSENTKKFVESQLQNLAQLGLHKDPFTIPQPPESQQRQNVDVQVTSVDPVDALHTQSPEYTYRKHLDPNVQPFKPGSVHIQSPVSPTFTQQYTTPTSRYKYRDEPQQVPDPLRDSYQFHPQYADQSIPHDVRQESPQRKDVEFCSEFTKFIVKKDLLLSRLTKFNDQPEFYAVWKSSFDSIMLELQVSATEEMDLLIKWLGPESSKQAVGLRAASASNPIRGLQRIWERLEERYASPEMVHASLLKKLESFPKLNSKDNKGLYTLADIVAEIECVKENPKYQTLLGYFDSSSGVSPVVSKLPYNIQEKWTTEAVRYKKLHYVAYPPFTVFASFLRDIAKVRNDPSFMYESTPSVKATKKSSTNVFTKKTGVLQKASVSTPQENRLETTTQFLTMCPIHNTNHVLNKCRGFRKLPIDERKQILSQNNLCYKCCSMKKHIAKHCKANIHCEVCKSKKHPTGLHVDKNDVGKSEQVKNSETHETPASHGGEGQDPLSINSNDEQLVSTCTQVCGDSFQGKSCGKTVLVKVYPKGQANKALKLYAIVDDQSNRTLAKTEFFDYFDVDTDNQIEYSLSSCTGLASCRGRQTSGYIIESLDGSTKINLPTLIECSQIPDVREEIPTPDVVIHHKHLEDLYDKIPPLDPESQILMLIGRDIPAAHHILDQKISGDSAPYAQKLKLGWVVIGETCLGKVHPPKINVNKTYVFNGRETLFEPCPNKLNLKEIVCSRTEINDIGSNVFLRSLDDNKIGHSIEDKQFLKIMDNEMTKNLDGNWVAPLPFKDGRLRLPNNRPQAMQRARILDKALRKDPTKKEHFVKFMKDILDRGHAEIAPPLEHGTECWYLPIFGIYHPRKKDQLRAVFDSSAKYEGICLNSVLLTGPDLTNNLLGILMRFRKEPVAIIGDVQKMFYSFYVQESHRDFLRFLWYKDNDPSQNLIEYRMRVHVFGNSPSPAVATYGLRKTVEHSEQDVKNFVCNNFYVDDGIISLPDPKSAIDLMKRTQDVLQKDGNIRLHKFASNNKDVMNAFSREDLAKDLKNIDLDKDRLPTQCSLGLIWDLESDSFHFSISKEPKPCTKRGILSVVNGLFDPLGFLAPVTIEAKLLLTEIVTRGYDWDEELPHELTEKWNSWKESLTILEVLQIPRTYSTGSLQSAKRIELHVYSDASEQAIAAVAYLKIKLSDEQTQVGFVLGKSKVAPTHGHTIPRLELCAALLAAEIGEIVHNHLEIKPDLERYYTDSNVVLGYINNTTRRFYKYVANRVDKIRYHTKPEDWVYVDTKSNPADKATRPVSSYDLHESMWLKGSPELCEQDLLTDNTMCDYPLITPEDDKEVRPSVEVFKSNINTKLGSKKFEKFSNWKKLIKAIELLKLLARKYNKTSNLTGNLTQCRTVQTFKEAEVFVIKEAQSTEFSDEIQCLSKGAPVSKDSTIISLNPYLDEQNVLRVGGRLKHSEMTFKEKHPQIVPKQSHITKLLITEIHEEVQHQGRHLTEGAIRSAGYWIPGGRRLISGIIMKCVKCRRLRGKQKFQLMADLPSDRITDGAPFSSVGVDVFGPWSVITRRTRGGQANSKRWAVMFTCLKIRAIHIEVIEEMSSSSFINALRRFTAIRGKVTEFRSDRGSNFIGATDDLCIDSINVEDRPVKQYLYNKGITWKFNPPHASHMGGAWERVIGVTRRILDSMLTDTSTRNLTHEVLCTLMAEIHAIVNSRPIVPVSTDPENPELLSPSMLLTHKSNCCTAPPTMFSEKDVYRSQWKNVQFLANKFWEKWRSEYLNTLQRRRKWTTPSDDLQTGDVVLLKDSSVSRCEWPTGLVLNAIKSADGKIRKVEIRTIKDGKPTTYTRPITETVLLVKNEN